MRLDITKKGVRERGALPFVPVEGTARIWDHITLLFSQLEVGLVHHWPSFLGAWQALTDLRALLADPSAPPPNASGSLPVQANIRGARTQLIRLATACVCLGIIRDGFLANLASNSLKTRTPKRPTGRQHEKILRIIEKVATSTSPANQLRCRFFPTTRNFIAPTAILFCCAPQVFCLASFSVRHPEIAISDGCRTFDTRFAQAVRGTMNYLSAAIARVSCVVPMR